MTRNLKNILENLPPALKEAFYADNTFRSIEDAANLGQIHNDINKINILQEEVTNILLGRSPLNNFIKALESRLNIQEAKLTIINKIIQDKIFEPLKNDLNQLEINKPKLTFQNIPQKETKSSEETVSQKEIKKYSYPEPSEAKAEKPINKLGELKKIVIPKNYSYLQEQELPKEKNKQIPPEKMPSKEEIAQLESGTEIKKEKNKIEPFETTEQVISEQELSAHDIPEYSFPEASEVKVEKPISKIGEFKKVIAPKTSSSKQEKIRNKLLEAMTKKDVQPKIVSEMKNVLLSKKQNKKEEKDQEELTKKQPEPEMSPSEILSGEGTKFREERPSARITEKKPYILDVKLKEIEQKKEEKEISLEPIKYQKYKKKNPFGKA